MEEHFEPELWSWCFAVVGIGSRAGSLAGGGIPLKWDCWVLWVCGVAGYVEFSGLRGLNWFRGGCH